MKTNNHCLRIALVYNGTVYQERVFSKIHEPLITAGEDDSNVFSVPAAGLPSSLELFEREPKGYCFRFTDKVPLSLEINGGDFDLYELIEDRRGVEVGSVETQKGPAVLYEVNLRIGDWGVLHLEKISIFFQVVEETDALAGRDLGESLDRTFAMILMLALFLHLVFLTVAFLQPPSPEFDEISYLDRFARIAVEDVRDAFEEEEPELDEIGGGESVEDDAGEMEAPEKERDQPDTPDTEAVEEVEVDVTSMGIHAALDQMDMSDNPLVGLLSDNAALDANLDLGFDANGEDRLSGRDGGAFSIRGQQEGRLGPGGLSQIGQAPGRSGGGPGADIGAPGPRDVSILVDESGPEVGDFCDPSDIRNVVQARSNAIRHCFERRLQTKPDLSGHITAAWRIQLDGSANRVMISNSTMNDQQVEGCIVRVIERMSFPEPSGGICMINFPFVFSGIE